MEALFELWQILLAVILLILAFFTGSIAERRHYKSIFRREDALGDLVVIVAKTHQITQGASEILAYGSAVIVE